MTNDRGGSRTVAQFAERTEALAYADMLRAAPAAWGCVAEATPAGWFLMAPTLDVLLFNRVIGAGVERPVSQSDVTRLVDRYRTAGLRNFAVQVSPAAEPADLAN